MANHDELGKKLREHLETLHARLTKKDGARQELIGLARKITKNSAKAIRLMHEKVRDFSRGSEISRLIEEAEIIDNAKMNDILSEYPDLIDSARDAQKELTEAVVFDVIMGALEGEETFYIPCTYTDEIEEEELRVDDVAYLHGLSEVVGELRRMMLDLMRKGDIEKAEQAFRWMEFIHEILRGFTHYPDAITNAIRRVVDISRSIVEKSRGDLTVAVLQEKLRKEMQEKK